MSEEERIFDLSDLDDKGRSDEEITAQLAKLVPTGERKKFLDELSEFAEKAIHETVNRKTRDEE